MVSPSGEPVVDLASRRIKALLDGADAAVADADKHEEAAQSARTKADADRWEAARLIVEQLDSGKTQTALAEEIGRSQTYVSLCAAVWREYGALPRGNTQSFGELMHVYKNAPAKERKSTADKAKAAGKSAATMANQQRRRQAREGALKIPTGKNATTILGVIAEANAKDEGLSSDDVAARAGMLGRGAEATVRSECARLEQAGWLVKDEVNKKPSVRTGSPVAVWYLSEEGALQFGLEHGWKAKKKRKARPRPPRPKNETPDERRQRLEREAIKRAQEEFLDRNSGAARFRSSLGDWRRWLGAVDYLMELTEKYVCPPNTAESLVQLLDHYVEVATATGEALRKQGATPVDLTHYKTLGVPVEATAAAVKKAYWELARKYHPDAGGDSDEKFKEIALAYATLSDPERRRLYNLYGSRRTT